MHIEPVVVDVVVRVVNGVVYAPEAFVIVGMLDLVAFDLDVPYLVVPYLALYSEYRLDLGMVVVRHAFQLQLVLVDH